MAATSVAPGVQAFTSTTASALRQWRLTGPKDRTVHRPCERQDIRRSPLRFRHFAEPQDGDDDTSTGGKKEGESL